MGGRVGFDLGACRLERLFSLVLGGAQPFGSQPNLPGRSSCAVG